MANIFGTNGDDTLNGGSGDDLIVARRGSDVINGNDGDDTILVRPGDGTGSGSTDTVDGGAGTDTILLQGSYDDYIVSSEGGAVVLTGKAGTDAEGFVEHLTSVEVVVFDDIEARIVDGGDSSEGAFSTIQSAVDASGEGDVVLVRGGTYEEQVVVDGIDGLTIDAVGDDAVTIQAPTDLVETVRGSDDSELNAVLTVIGSEGVSLEDITIDGAGNGDNVEENDGSASAEFVGVAFRNASGSLNEVNITGVRDAYSSGTTLAGAQRGSGLLVDNDEPVEEAPLLEVTMEGGSISDFQKNGALISYANISMIGVMITGGGAQTVVAQNGIQLDNSTGLLSENEISDIGYSGSQTVDAVGILLTGGNDGLDIDGNLISGTNDETTDTQMSGIYVYSTDGANSGGSIVNNVISHADAGILAFDEITPLGINIETNEIVNLDTSDAFSVGVYHTPNTELENSFFVEGSEFFDLLAGAAGNDTLTGFGGDDELYGEGGNDTLYGGDGQDILDGGEGADYMVGGNGNDTYHVDNAGDQVIELQGGGTDTVVTSLNNYRLPDEVEYGSFDGTGSATLRGNELDNLLNGGDDDSKLLGAAGNDTILGNGGNDTLNGGAGDNVLIGGEGNDTYFVNSSTDTIIELEDEGIDRIISNSLNIDLNNFDNVEEAVLNGGGALNLTGNELDNLLSGNAATNSLMGEDGNDTIRGGAGDDMLYGGEGNDVLQGDAGQDTLVGGAGEDVFVFDSAANADANWIEDFETDLDLVDVSQIAAFTYVGYNGFTGDGTAELRVTALNNKDKTVLRFDTDGDGNQDFRIDLNGIYNDLEASDFLL